MDEPRDGVRAQYEAALEIERKAREHLFTKSGDLMVSVASPSGEPMPNPYLSEWHRAVQLVRALAAELGITEESDVGPLAHATGGDPIEALDALLMVLAEAIDHNKGHGLAALSREYRETLSAVKELRDAQPGDDHIGRLVAEGAARAHRLGLSVL